MTVRKALTAPRHLSVRGKKLWNELYRTYSLDDPAGLELLRRPCEASDRADAALAQVAEEGLTFVDRAGAIRVHPAVNVERDARLAVARLARELRITDPPEDDRPARLGGAR